MTEARISRADRKTQRVRAVTDPSAATDTVPELAPVVIQAKTLARLVAWAVSNPGAVFAGIAAVIGGVYATVEIVVSARKSEDEQAELVRDVKSIDARLHNIEGQLKVLVERKEHP